MKTFEEFNESVAAARGALKLLKAASRAGRTVRTADGGRRITSAARVARTAKPNAVLSRVERGETWQDVGNKIDIQAKLNPSSKFYNPSFRTSHRSRLRWDKNLTAISGNKPRDKNITIARSAAKKAGFSGGGNKNRNDMKPDDTKFYTTYPQDKYPEYYKHPKHNTQVDTQIDTYPSGRRVAALSSGNKLPGYVRKAGNTVVKRVPSTNEIARKMKEFRRRVVTTGGQERNPVHKVDFIPRRDDYGIKGELDKNSMKVGRNFMRAQRNLPKELERAGAKPGDIVIGSPSPMRSGEDVRLGIEKRAKMYQKSFGSRVKGLDPTGRVKGMIGSAGGNVK